MPEYGQIVCFYEIKDDGLSQSRAVIKDVHTSDCVDLMLAAGLMLLRDVVYMGWLMGAKSGWAYPSDAVIYPPAPVKEYALGKIEQPH